MPLIAVANGLALGSTIFLYEQSEFAWQGFWMTAWFTSIVALLVGALLAAPALVFGGHLPEPKILFLALIGGLAGPLPLLAIGGSDASAGTLVTFAALGVLSAGLWWLLVERHRAPASRTDA